MKSYLFILAFALPTFANAQYRGDVNNDSKVNMADVSALIGVLKSSVSPTDGVGDMNADGLYSLTDVNLLVQEILSNNFSLLYEYVDLGLSSGTLWATSNIGAANPEDFGNYYAWGETETKVSYTEANYKFYYNGAYSRPSQTDISRNFILDAARVNLGDEWRMPTKTETEELLSSCTWTSTTTNGVNGYTVTGPSGKSIFMPCAGMYNSEGLQSAGTMLYYWTSTRSTDLASSAYVLSNTGYTTLWTTNRSYGLPIRPVRYNNNK